LEIIIFLLLQLFPQLKTKLTEIESTMNEREAEMMSTKLREEYMEQLEKMKNLRTLYEERARLSVIERENLRQELDAVKQEYNLEIEKLVDNIQKKNSSKLKFYEFQVQKFGRTRPVLRGQPVGIPGGNVRNENPVQSEQSRRP
jgi:hypothetical protein